MSTASTLRERRHAVQLHALADVRHHIGDQDSTSGRKYLADFTRAFRSYSSVINSHDVRKAVNTADIVLIGDYHALPASQRFAATLVEQRAALADRPVVLAVEAILARDQHVLDEWWRREIIELELRRRIRFDHDWGYDWDAFHEVLANAREYADAVYAIDCMPRDDFRKIAARDRHAAHKICDIRRRHPHAVIMVLCGESHLAPNHLPRLLRSRLKQENILTVLQNVDALYWRATRERRQVQAVRVNDRSICVFNSTPLEKYESYRLCLSRWDSDPGAAPDITPTIYNLITSLAAFLKISCHSAPNFLIDSLPEVYSIESGDVLARQLAREGLGIIEIDAAISRIEDYGCVYIPQVNTFFVREFRMMYAAEEAARVLHHLCRADRNHVTNFHGRTVETALGVLGSMLLHPVPDPADPRLANIPDKEIRASSELLGSMLGDAMYRGYIRGRVSPSFIRQLFLTRISKTADAKKVFDRTSAKLERKHSALSNRHSAH